MRIRPPRVGRPRSESSNHSAGQGDPAPSQGISLATRLTQESRVLPDEASDIVAQLARILTAGHASGHVHGDVRPATIGFGPDGRVVFISAPAPRAGESLPYLAPERIERQRPGTASDIYALGAVFFELLVGRPPYAGRSPERIGSLVTVPGQIDGLVTAMLADEPVKRPKAEEVLAVLESGVDAPPKRIVAPSARTWRSGRFSPPVLGALMVLLLTGLVFGSWGALRAGEAASTMGRAEPLAEILPTSFALAFNLSVERDALRSSGRVSAEFLKVTNESIKAWTREVDGIEASDDPGLRRRTERTAAALERLSDFRVAARLGDRANADADVATYTNAVNGLFDLAAELPTFQDDDLARQARNLESIGPVSEVLGFERKIMATALRKGEISEKGISDLSAAQSSWTTHSESIYEDAAPPTRKALDSISGGSFAYGSYGVTSQRAVIRVLNARDVDDVVRQLKDGSAGVAVDQFWLADAATFVQDLKNVIVDAAQKLADDIDAKHSSAQNRLNGWRVLIVVSLVALAALGVATYRARRRSGEA
ncbi:protein kinase-like protein [Nocardioides albertanoniae]|uniref:non-specific serine/threonine protein kinase n=1 Tax=Nocardioides albertanoniae TaxID=1175486 RepID=A0A543ACY6_9ACTN|nr:nitrate- and nitrite sensing domain-containing protein [Nocardioides albertanoniae]TQL70366.1 protein kinase-like protein [Nocardioides albertanoniae]